MEILATLHPENNPNDDLFPNVKKENIPSKAINLSKLSPEVQAKLPKVINTDEVLPATKLKYLEIDGVTYNIPQRVDVTSNIKITANKNDILASDHKLLCLLSNTSSLAIKVVDKIEGGSEEISTLSEVLPQVSSKGCCATHNENIYIFGGYSSGLTVANTIYKFNCVTKTIETLSVTLPKALRQACCAAYKDNIYIFGGYDNSTYSNTIYKFNCTNETIETLSITIPKNLYTSCCAIYEDNIYIFGGYNGTYSNTIYKFNCTNETIETLSITLPKAIGSALCSIHGVNIYIFGGYAYNNNLNTIYKFNCATETITKLSVTLPSVLADSCCSIFNNNIYIFGGGVDSRPSNTIYKFNCTNETIETLSITLPKASVSDICSIYGANIYIFGGEGLGSTLFNTIYNFSVSFELIANNVLILNANSKYSFDLITDQVTIPINKVYIGDSNNTGQLANAYIYDETQSTWINVNTGEVLTL